ncbi:MAG: pyridoxal phosphate-dependent aminotransferase [Chlorobi bacterium]|nr:pyridoxal phosphate-dependent aminotransferase [Chlorobiota bacterium]
MPQLSELSGQMPASPIRKLVPFANAAKKRGIKVYHLNIGQPDIPTPENVLEAIRQYNEPLIAYTQSQGTESYRQGLARYYQKHGIDVTADDIIVTTGGSEALLFTVGSIANPGDEIIIPEPYYANYNSFVTLFKVKVVPVQSRIEDNFALPPVEAFEELITPRTKAILYSNPSNPTGYVYSKEEIGKLRQLALKHDIFIIADEVYREFIYGDTKHHSILHQPDMETHGIIVDSVSKRYSMCGARIGAVVSKNKELMASVLKFAQARLSPPTLGQYASEAALDTPQSYFDEVIDEYKTRRDILIEGLESIPGVKIGYPKGAFYLMAELPVDDTDRFARWLLESFSHNGETVMVAPASGFYSNPALGSKQVRIAYVLNTADLRRSVELLRMAIEQYNQEK